MLVIFLKQLFNFDLGLIFLFHFRLLTRLRNYFCGCLLVPHDSGHGVYQVVEIGTKPSKTPQGIFIMDKLAFFAVTTLARCLYMPLFAHFGFVVLMGCFLLEVQLAQAVSVGTLIVKFTVALFHEVFAQLCFIVYAEVLNVLYHLFSR